MGVLCVKSQIFFTANTMRDLDFRKQSLKAFSALPSQCAARKGHCVAHVFHIDLTRTKVEDAVKALVERMPDSPQHGPSTIMTTRTQFPEFSVRTLLSLWSATDADGNGLAMGMASADFFTARRAIRFERERYPIEKLEGAHVDEFANVTCMDGTHLFDICLERMTLRGELYPAEWRVLEFCVAMHEGKRGDPERIEFYPELAARLNGFRPRCLKQVIGYIRDNQSDPGSLSIETLRSALRMMGIRRPTRGVYAQTGKSVS